MSERCKQEQGFLAPEDDWGLAARSDGRARAALGTRPHRVVRRGRTISVRYVDARRFGRLDVARRDIAGWTALGPDPLADGVEIRQLCFH